MSAAKVTVTRTYQLGASSTFETTDAADFRATVISDARDQRAGGDMQGIGYSVPSVADARAIGAEDTVGGWYVRDLDLEIGVVAS